MQPQAKRNNFIPIIIVTWALILVVAFLSFRAEDSGRLPNLLNNLAHGTLFGAAGLSASLGGVFIACLILLAWYGLGSFVVLAIQKINGNQPDENTSNYLDLPRNCAVGAAVWSLFWFFVGSVGYYKTVVAIASLLIGLALFFSSAFYQWRLKKTLPQTDKIDFIGKIAFGILLFVFSIALVSAVAPPTAKDALLYHFAVPKNFISAGNNAVIEGNIASYLALGTEMQIVWAMLLGNIFSFRVGEVAASATIFAFFPLLLLATYGWARELNLEKTWALIAALLVATIPTAYHVASNGYIDLALALYITLAIQAICRWWQTLLNEWLFYAALCLGAALAIKLTALFAVVAIALVILLRVRIAQNDDAEKSRSVTLLLKGTTALVCAGVLASPWYFRDWIATGSPFFPFYLNVWNGTAAGWDAERSVFFQLLNSRYGGFPKSILDYLIAPFAISLRAQPESPEFFDGVLGIAFLFGLPLIFWVYRCSLLKSEIKIALLISGCLFIFWLLTSQQLRYLLPIFPSLAVAIAFSCVSLSAENKTLRQTLAVLLLFISVVSGSVTLAWFAQKNPLQVAFGGESRENYLARSLDYYPYYQIVNEQLPPNSKIWLINMRRDTYHIDKPYFSDYMFEDYTFKQLLGESKSLPELQTRIKQMGITHILVRHDFLLDYQQSTLVDDRRSEKENRDHLKIVRDLIFSSENTIRSDSKFSLLKVP